MLFCALVSAHDHCRRSDSDGRRPREAAVAAQTKPAATLMALAARGLLRKDLLNGEAGGGVYDWKSREAAEDWFTPEWLAWETFGAAPVITCSETHVTVDNIKR